MAAAIGAGVAAGYLVYAISPGWAPLAGALAGALVLPVALRPLRELGALLEFARALGRGEQADPPAGQSGVVGLLGKQMSEIDRRNLGHEHSMKGSASTLIGLADSLAPAAEATETKLQQGSQQARQAGETLRSARVHVDDLSGRLGHQQQLAADSQSAAIELDTTNQAVSNNVHQLAESVDETAASIEEMTYSIKEVARNIEDLSLAAEQTATSMNQMDSSISEVESNVQITSQLADEVAVDAGKGAEAVQRSLEGIDKIRVTVTTASSVIGSLGERIREIGNILGVIEEVAEQTNLLALNAAIIAAQAGEHGRGFAVVAEEIKELSDKTGASTKEISVLIKSIQDEARNAVEAIEVGERNVHVGVTLSREAEGALAKIQASSAKSTQRFKTIAAATAEQARGSKIVADAVERIARSVQQVAAATAEQARGSEQLMRSAERIKSITHQVERTSQEQGIGGKQILQFAESLADHLGSLETFEQSMRTAFDEFGSVLDDLASSGEDGEGLIAVLRQLEPRLRTEADRLASRSAGQISTLSL